MSETNEFDIKTIVCFNKYNGTEEEITIPDGVTVIGDSAFENNKNIKSIIMPNTVISIGASAFKGCISLEKIIFSDNIKLRP